MFYCYPLGALCESMLPILGRKAPDRGFFVTGRLGEIARFQWPGLSGNGPLSPFFVCRIWLAKTGLSGKESQVGKSGAARSVD
jgi:hypothetical protein